MHNYIFTSSRLGFRNWKESDLKDLSVINTDKDVMGFFPGLQFEDDSKKFIERMQKLYYEKGFCYFAVEKLEHKEFIGFIGLCEQNYEADFTPCIDIGWRLKKHEWNKGYATEGATECLTFAFVQLNFEKIYAITPVINVKSELIMKKIGMQKVKTFIHPKLVNDKRLQECLLYEKTKHNHYSH